MKKNKPGFSLVESMIYIALFGAIFTVLVQFAVNVGENNQKARAKNQVDTTHLFINQHIASTLADGYLVSEGSSLFDSVQGELQLTMDADLLDYSVSNGTLIVDRNGTVSPITNGTTSQVTSFLIEKIYGDTLLLEGIRVTIDIRDRKYPNISQQIITAYKIDI